MSHLKPTFRLKSLAAAGMLCLSGAVWAVDPFVIQDIRVEGLQRVDTGTIFRTIPVKVGDTYNDTLGAASIRALFDLGLFQDVRIDVRGKNMVVVVQERQIINQVDIQASREFKKEALLAGLASFGVVSGMPYDKARLEKAMQELQRQYQKKGFYATQIIPTITPDARNRVNVLLTINDGKRARIRDIEFVGNQAFSDARLERRMRLNDGNWISWLTKSNVYSEEKMSADLDAVRNYYKNRGYLEFRIDSVQVALSADKRSQKVVVHVTEGSQYTVSAVTMAGNYLNRDAEFQSLIKIKPNRVYKIEDVAETVDNFEKRFGKYGYAFAKVQVLPDIDREKKLVSLEIAAEPAQRAYVRRINIKGNTKTRDAVIRRELRQYESSWFNGEKIATSKERLNRLGYFDNVNVETQPVEGTTDQADLKVEVKERPTGSLEIGMGFSSTDKLSFSFGLSQDNLFGSGQTFSARINTSKYNQTYSVETTNPYFTNSGISRTFYLNHRKSKPSPGQGGDYIIRSDMAGVSFGVPVSEVDTVYFGGGFERYSIKPGNSPLPPHYLDYVNNYGRSAWGIPLTIGWARDTRNSALVPTSGAVHRLNATVSPVGDMRYGMLTYKYQQYFPLTKKVTLMFNTDLRYGKGFSCKNTAGSFKTNCFPFYKNFFMGGIGSVRGFEDGAIGAQQFDRNTNSEYSIGGDRAYNINLELQAPFPGSKSDKTLRMFAFVDAGALYTSRSSTYIPNKLDKKMRASAGVGIRWLSPMGPLTLSYGYPFKKQPKDRLQRFQFSMGASF